MRPLWVAGAVAAAALAAAGAWYGLDLAGRRQEPAPPTVQALPSAAPAEGGGVESVGAPDPAQAAGTTPMAQRVAVLGLLNKRNGVSRDLTLRPGKALRVGDTIVRLRACERTAPWEQQPLTGAFVQLDVQGSDRVWRRGFSGWLFKERPQLNVVLHPVYDVWVKSCTMTFPETGADTISSAPPAGASRARKSAGATPATDDGEAPPEPSASDSNAT